jgi:hypothetical protein
MKEKSQMQPCDSLFSGGAGSVEKIEPAICH